MRKKIRTLIVEDVEADALLMLMRLEDAGYDVVSERVENADEMMRALNEPWDIVLSDFSMPRFDAPRALEILKSTGRDIPFLLVSGTVGEERAVSMMRAGASDFVVKNDLIRLVPAIERELRDAENRRTLRDTDRRYQLIVETASEGIWVVDFEARTTFVNASLARMLGYRREEMIGRLAFDFIDETAREEVRARFVRRNVGVSEQYDCQFRRKDGTELWGIVSATPVVMGDRDEFLGSMAMITDVTERKREEQERAQLYTDLQEALRARDEFLSIASHELKTPMTPMKINLQSIERILAKEPIENASRSRLVKLLGGVAKEFDRLVHLVDELLDVARIRTGRLTLTFTEMNLSNVVQGVVDRFREQLKRVGSELVLSIQPDVVMVGDVLRIEEIVVNLLSNAIRFGGGKPIKVSLEGGATSSVLKVQDFGIGISREDQERIFNRFERAVSEKNYGGMGLGLYIVRQILEGHGGVIRVESELGSGATFIVEMPLDSTAVRKESA